MKKYCKLLVIVVAFAHAPLECGLGGGFSKLWEGTKEIAQGTWDVVSSPFRSKKDKNGEKKNKKLNNNKQEKETCNSCGEKCNVCTSRREAKKNKRKNK